MPKRDSILPEDNYATKKPPKVKATKDAKKKRKRIRVKPYEGAFGEL